MRSVSTMSCLALLAIAGTPAIGQGRFHQPGSQGGRFQQPGAAMPRPMSGLGGVRSEAPRPIPIDQSPAQPQYVPMPVGPWPGVVVTPQSPRPLPGGRPLGNPGFDGRGTFVGPGFGPAGGMGSHPESGGGGMSGHPAPGSGGIWGHPWSGGGFSGGSGLTVDGAYNGDHWKLRLHLGSDAFSHPICRPRYGYPIGWNYPIWYYDYLSYYGNRYDTLYGYYSPPDPAMTYVPTPAPAPTTEAVTPSTNRELGDTYLSAGDARGAIKAYRAHLKQYPGDEEAMRSLGLALIDAGQTTEGVAMIAMAYKAEPLLCDRPFSANLFRYGDDGLARDLSRVSVYANRVKSSSGWLALAVFMQAQGRDDLAKTMTERARAAGLEAVIADRMISALR